MVNSAVVIPCAVLGSICVVMFVFMFWWFPRHYQKGVNMDRKEMDAEKAARDAYMAQWQARRDAEANGEQLPADQLPAYKPPPKAYVPPVTMY